jgi:hypothetical protein
MFVLVLGESSAWGWNAIELKSWLSQAAYQVVRPNVDPGNKILLSDIFTIKEAVEVDHRRARKVLIPHTARRRFVVLST